MHEDKCVTKKYNNTCIKLVTAHQNVQLMLHPVAASGRGEGGGGGERIRSVAAFLSECHRT